MTQQLPMMPPIQIIRRTDETITFQLSIGSASPPDIQPLTQMNGDGQ